MRYESKRCPTGERRRVFCASMADVFEDRRELDPWRGRLWELIDATPWLDWQLLTKRPENVRRLVPWLDDSWRENVWLGVTVEDQKRADERIPVLQGITVAGTRFLSCEPLLGPVDLPLVGIDWVIVGGESGAGARPFDVRWAREIMGQCRVAHVACFVKQLGRRPLVALSDARTITDPKGGDWAEWPEDLRVREFPP